VGRSTEWLSIFGEGGSGRTMGFRYGIINRVWEHARLCKEKNEASRNLRGKEEIFRDDVFFGEGGCEKGRKIPPKIRS